MILGTIIFRVVGAWWAIIKIVALSPFMFLKASFLWFFTSFAMSYIFFLVVHKFHMIYVRKDLAIELVRSLVMGFFIATMLMAFYEFLLWNFVNSRFFAAQQQAVQNLDLLSGNYQTLYQNLCFLTVLLSGLLATHYVGKILDGVHESHISDRYGWAELAITLLCCGFIWVVNYIF